MNRWLKRTFTMFAASTMLAACGARPTSAGGDNGVVQHDDGKADAIGGFEAPETLVDGASRRLAANIVGEDVGKTFGTDDAHVPYPDTYWPFTDEGSDAHWNGGDSPVEKFMKLADAGNLQAAKDWEHNNHGSGVPGVAGWWGHCPGWTGASMANAPIKHAVNAKLDGGAFVACAEGSDGCTKFEIGDINALEAEVYVDGDSSFIGGRCDTAATSVKRDANGRIETPGCGGVNPGTLLIVAAARMKKQHLPFAIDAQNDYNTDQIWNQPAYRYTVNRFQALTAAQAANLVVHGTMDGDATSYPYNADAKGFALVDSRRCAGCRSADRTRRWCRASPRRARRAWSPSSSSTSRRSNSHGARSSAASTSTTPRSAPIASPCRRSCGSSTTPAATTKAPGPMATVTIRTSSRRSSSS